MKKSEALRRAQASVINDSELSMADTLEVLNVLIDAERLEAYAEKQEENPNG